MPEDTRSGEDFSRFIRKWSVSQNKSGKQPLIFSNQHGFRHGGAPVACLCGLTLQNSEVVADTSALVAWFHPADEFAWVVTAWFRERSPEFCWNSFLRAELRHNLRRLQGEYAAVAWHAYRSSERAQRLKLGVQRLSDLLEWGDELSARHAQASSAGTWDFVHVAAAQHIRPEVFVTCDAAQADLAKMVGMTDVHLFR